MAKLCEYHNSDWVDRYNGLEYGSYKVSIEGNTFYIKVKNYDGRDFHEKIINKPKFKEWDLVVMIVMCTVKEETINDVLRSYNFHCKYEWLKEVVV